MPDFENFRKAVLCQGEPARVPQFDGSIAEDIKTQFLGKPIAGLEEEVEFCMAAGYDTVPLAMGFRQWIRGERMGIIGGQGVSFLAVEAGRGSVQPVCRRQDHADVGRGSFGRDPRRIHL